MYNPSSTVTGVILAGGLARRMQQQDKGLVLYNRQPLIQYAINAMQPVVNHLLLNVNHHQEHYQHFGFPIIADQTSEYQGPLAGILSAMLAATTPVLLIAPCDSPLITSRHLQRLLDTRTAAAADVAVAFDGQHLHPVFLALKTELKAPLERYLASGQRKITDWLMQQNLVQVDFSDQPEAFINVNTHQELIALEQQTGPAWSPTNP